MTVKNNQCQIVLNVEQLDNVITKAKTFKKFKVLGQ